MDKAPNYESSKVLVMADKWYTCRTQTQQLKKGPKHEHLHALGKYEKAGEALACSVEQLRKATKVES